MDIKLRQHGFTLIEMIVSLGLFAVTVTIAVGALLAVIDSNRQLQDEQNVLSNVAFALDSMTREIRTGTSYLCISDNNTTNPRGRIFGSGYDLEQIDSGSYPNAGSPYSYIDCSAGRELAGANPRRFQGIAFKEGGESITGDSNERIVYFHDGSSNQQTIYRRVGSQAPVPIISDAVNITAAEFFVTGSAPLTGADTDDHQASVTIFVTAQVDDGKEHHLQTSVTQRALDI